MQAMLLLLAYFAARPWICPETFFCARRTASLPLGGTCGFIAPYFKDGLYNPWGISQPHMQHFMETGVYSVAVGQCKLTNGRVIQLGDSPAHVSQSRQKLAPLYAIVIRGISKSDLCKPLPTIKRIMMTGFFSLLSSGWVCPRENWIEFS